MISEAALDAVRRYRAVRVNVDVSLSLVANVLDLGAQLVLGLLLARALGVVGIGMYFVGTTAATFGWLLVSPGISSLLPREIAKGRLSAEMAVANYAAFRLIVSLPMSCAILLVALIAGPAEYRLPLFVGWILVAGLFTNTFLQSVFEGVHRFDLKLLTLLGYRAFVIIGALVSVAARLPVDGAIAIQATATWCSVVITASLLSRGVCRIRLRIDRALWSRIVVMGMPIMLTSLLFQLSGRLDTLLLAGLADSRAVGLYSAANLALSVFSAPAFAIVVGAFPTIAECSTEGVDRAPSVIRRGAVLIVLVTLVGTAAALFVAPIVVPLFFGAEFGASVPLMRVLSLALLPAGLARLAVYALVAIDRSRIAWMVTAGSLAVATTVDLVAIPLFGPLGAAWVTVGGEILTLVAASLALRRSVAGSRGNAAGRSPEQGPVRGDKLTGARS